MNSESEKAVEATGQAQTAAACGSSGHELAHLRSSWCWFVALGVLLVTCGLTALVYPGVSSLAAVAVLGIVLIIGGIATIIGSFWAGKWSGLLVQLLVGILYVVAGMAVTERPLVTIALITFFLAVSFIVLGVFRTIGALIIRFPQWGWALLNGMVTFICGMVIFRSLPFEALWVVGVLVGVELLLNGWTWIMLGRQLRKLPKEIG
jgi:uncharacterized membrane protein HdeD (DUF308 family)